MLALNGWLDTIGLVDWARGSAHVYPWANVLHVLGVVLLVGGIAVVDLRIIGVWQQLPAVALSNALTPIAAAGLALQFGSGLVLFAADGEALSGSGVLHAKLVLMALAIGNAAIFRLRWKSSTAEELYFGSTLARASALFSLALWLAIAAVGRLIAYY